MDTIVLINQIIIPRSEICIEHFVELVFRGQNKHIIPLSFKIIFNLQNSKNLSYCYKKNFLVKSLLLQRLLRGISLHFHSSP